MRLYAIAMYRRRRNMASSAGWRNGRLLLGVVNATELLLNRTARTTCSMRGSSMRSYAIAMYRSEKVQKHGQLGRVEEVQEEHRHCS